MDLALKLVRGSGNEIPLHQENTSTTWLFSDLHNQLLHVDCVLLNIRFESLPLHL